jgi:hypothetical protein
MAPRLLGAHSRRQLFANMAIATMRCLLPIPLETKMRLILLGGLRHGASGSKVRNQDCTRPKTVDVGRTYIAEAEARIGRGTSSSRGSCGREDDDRWWYRSRSLPE